MSEKQNANKRKRQSPNSMKFCKKNQKDDSMICC